MIAPARVPSANAVDGIFRTFWMGGFESAGHLNTRDERLDLVMATQHDAQLDGDYELMTGVGMRVTREAARWPVIETSPGSFDVSTLTAVARSARRAGVQVVWTLCHYGWPRDLDVFHGSFVARFAAYCNAIAHALRGEGERAPLITPLNEISFLAWAAGEVGYIWPRARGRGEELKRILVRAHLAGVDAFRCVLPDTRVAIAEPLIVVHVPRGRPDLAAEAARRTDAQYGAAELITGHREPGLGGAPAYLDLVGLNYYHGNQMVCPGNDADSASLSWADEPRDGRWRPLHLLLQDARKRYDRPIFIAETSHFGIGRARWLHEIAHEVNLALRIGVDVAGICLYPLIDRPDWEDSLRWHNSGLWDVVPDSDGTLRRVLNSAYSAGLRDAQALLARAPGGIER